MDEEPVAFTKNKRLIEKGVISHIGGSVRGKKSIFRTALEEEEEYKIKKALEHQQDIDDAFGNY